MRLSHFLNDSDVQQGHFFKFDMGFQDPPIQSPIDIDTPFFVGEKLNMPPPLTV